MAILGLLLLSGSGASAFELFGFKLFEDQSEIDADAVIGDPQSYLATLETSAPGDIESAIRNASAVLKDQATPASGAAGLIAKARSDYRRILAALYNQGHFGGTISILVGGKEAANLPPDTSLPDPVAVVLRVNPGPLFRFGSVRLAPAAPPASDEGDRVDTPDSVGFGAGLVARATVINKAEQLALEAWRQQGYAEAAVARSDVVADHATNTVDVTITIAPGRRATVGEVSVSGTARMDPEFVARMTDLHAGDEYDPDDIKRAEKRLARLDVFRAMRVEAAGAIGSDGVLPFDVVVEEQPERRFGIGATYSTIDGLGLEGFHLWRNLFGRAERLRLDAKVAGINWPVNSSEFDYAFGGTFTKPGFLNPDNDLVAAIAAERTVLPAYTETSASARVGMTQYLNDQLTLDGSLYYERSLFEDDYGERNFSLAGLTGGLIWDARDDATDPAAGFYVNVTAEPFYEFYYGNAAFRTTAEVRGYLRLLGDDKLVLAGRAKVGALVGPPIDETPPDRLFFAGGGGSVRGYAYRGIGVEQPDGTVTGGRYLVEGSLEARYRVTSDIGVVAFIDGGYVAADTFAGLDQLRVGVGAGLRYYTGLGPLRLDVAVPLNKRRGDPDYGIYLGIGQAF
ncbi:autotransporter assembly complex family protein [Devosia sp.]|uniref:autotransporter assembly complex protein TamA n=1 Tax=Devosia sp. TaxID=1871048 RepID=UPI0025B99370|nr:autotransporter assembly complex family protein [Devosia sp.]